MSSHLKAILMPVCLKILVIFLICGDEKVKAAHFVCLLRGVVMKGFVREMFRCILSLSRVYMFTGMPLLCPMCKICFHSMRCCSAFSGMVSILLMRKLQAAILCSGG
jgi:hypothetical protein